jgi:hypothetical protein
MSDLTHQLDTLLKKQWRWCDLRLSVADSCPSHVIYNVAEHGKHVGQITITLVPAKIPKQAPQSASLDEEDQKRG